jgi:hypothetical protein
VIADNRKSDITIERLPTKHNTYMTLYDLQNASSMVVSLSLPFARPFEFAWRSHGFLGTVVVVAPARAA